MAGSTRFQMAILAVILANAVVIGLETYDGIERSHRDLLHALDRVFLGVFVVELTIRIAAHGRRPLAFFRGGWNCFDFAVVAATFVPGVGANVTLLRMIRVLRVVRLVEVLEDLRVIVRGLVRSLTPLAGVASLVVIITYVYAIVGTALFGDDLPGEWGTAGTAMLTCFRILTLDNWDDIYFPARDVSSWATVFFLSYILIATFVVLNVVIAVVVSSVEEARRVELEENADRLAAEVADEAPELAERILAMRQALDDLERSLPRAAGDAEP